MSLLSLQTVTKIFGGLTAVNEVSFDVEQGSIVGLIGPNGAGKTTVFNLITGNYVPDGGDIRFAGQSIKGMQTAYHRGPRHCPDVPVHPPVPHAAAGGERPCGPPLPDAQRDHRLHVPHPGAAPRGAGRP